MLTLRHITLRYVRVENTHKSDTSHNSTLTFTVTQILTLSLLDDIFHFCIYYVFIFCFHIFCIL